MSISRKGVRIQTLDSRALLITPAAPVVLDGIFNASLFDEIQVQLHALTSGSPTTFTFGFRAGGADANTTGISEDGANNWLIRYVRGDTALLWACYVFRHSGTGVAVPAAVNQVAAASAPNGYCYRTSTQNLTCNRARIVGIRY